MFDSKQFREQIIIPTLSKLQCYSKAAEELLVFTCAAESVGGTYLKQISGPALGIYQMEPATFTDIWVNYLYHRQDKINLLSLHLGVSKIPYPEQMVYDLRFATAMARFHYLRQKEALPNHDDLEGIWKYYKKYWNTELGKAKKAESIKLYKKFIQD
jgi:hypothetical protein